MQDNQQHQLQHQLQQQPLQAQRLSQLPRGAVLVPRQDDKMILAQVMAHAADAAVAAGHISGEFQVPGMPGVLVHHVMPSRPEHLTAWPPASATPHQPGEVDGGETVTGPGSSVSNGIQSSGSSIFKPDGLFTWHNSVPEGLSPRPLLEGQRTSGTTVTLGVAQPQELQVNFSYGDIGGPQSGPARHLPGNTPGTRFMLREITGSCRITVKRNNKSSGRKRQSSAASKDDSVVNLCSVKVRVRRFYIYRDRYRLPTARPALSSQEQQQRQQQQCEVDFWLPDSDGLMLARVAFNVFTGEVLESSYLNTSPEQLMLTSTESSEPASNPLQWSTLARLLQDIQQQQQVVTVIPVVELQNLIASYHQQSAQQSAPAAAAAALPLLPVHPQSSHLAAVVPVAAARTEQPAQGSVLHGAPHQQAGLQPENDELDDEWLSRIEADLLADIGDTMHSVASPEAAGPTTAATVTVDTAVADLAATGNGAAAAWATAETATGGGPFLQLTPAVEPQVIAAARAAAAAAQILADPDELCCLTSSLLSWEDQAVRTSTQLKQQVWAVYRGKYREQTSQQLQMVCAQLQRFNLLVGHEAPCRLDLLNMRDDFLGRNILHVAGSIVAVEYGGGSMSETARHQLLQVTYQAVGSSGFQQLLSQVNKNQAPPLFTCGHFARQTLAPLRFIMEQGDLSLEHLLATTKRLKMPHHIISTMAAPAAGCTPQQRQQCKEGLQLLLALVAQLIAKRVVRRTPQQLQQQAEHLGLQHIQQQWQQRQPAHVLSPMAQSAETVCSSSGAAADEIPTTNTGCLTQDVLRAKITYIAEQQRRRPDDPAAPAVWSGATLWAEVVWWLQHYYLYHTAWQSKKKASPRYCGVLLQEVVQELFSFEVRQHTSIPHAT